MPKLAGVRLVKETQLKTPPPTCGTLPGPAGLCCMQDSAGAEAADRALLELVVVAFDSIVL